jgi:chromosome partitioning protein
MNTETRIIALANQKGGVGKTTTAVNVAAALAASGHRVLVVDLDPQGNASTALGIDHHNADILSVYDVLLDGKPVADAVQVVKEGEGRLFCLPSTIDLAGAEIEMVSLVARELRLKNALAAYEQPLDYILIDCPPSLGLLTTNALVTAKEVLVPVQCEYYALEGISQLMKTINMLQSHYNPTLHISTVLLTMYNGSTRLSQQVEEDVRNHFAEQTLKTRIPRRTAVGEAPSHGQTMLAYERGNDATMAYVEVARELVERGAR